MADEEHAGIRTAVSGRRGWGESVVMGRFLAWVALGLVGLVVAGMLAVALIKTVLGFAFYLVVGALVVGGGVYLYRRARYAIAPGTRARRRLEAAAETYRMRDR